MVTQQEEIDVAVARQLIAFEKLWETRLAAMDTRIIETKQSTSATLAATLEATRRSDEALERRFQNVNEFRDAMKDQTNRFALRTECDQSSDNLRRELDDVRVAQTRNDAHFEALEKTERVTHTQLEHRLASMNEFRAQLTEQAGTFITRTEYDAGHEPLIARINEANKPNYAVAGSFASLVVGMVAAMWLVIGLKIDNANMPLTLSVEQLKTTQMTRGLTFDSIEQEMKANTSRDAATTQATAIAEKDRVQLTERLRTLETEMENGKLERLTSFAQVNLELAKIDQQLNGSHRK
jgi:hypothetical protein